MLGRYWDHQQEVHFINSSYHEHLRSGLVGPKVQSSSSTFHNHGRAQSAENAGLVVFGGIEVRHDGIVGVRELCVASWADRTLAFTNAGKLQVVCAIRAIDMTIYGMTILASHLKCPRSDSFLPAHLHVVTTARPVTSLRHFSTLQRSVNSMVGSTEAGEGRNVS